MAITDPSNAHCVSSVLHQLPPSAVSLDDFFDELDLKADMTSASAVEENSNSTKHMHGQLQQQQHQGLDISLKKFLDDPQQSWASLAQATEGRTGTGGDITVSALASKSQPARRNQSCTIPVTRAVRSRLPTPSPVPQPVTTQHAQEQVQPAEEVGVDDELDIDDKEEAYDDNAPSPAPLPTLKRKRNRVPRVRKPTEMELEAEAMAGVDPKLAVLGPPSRRDLRAMVGTHVTVLGRGERRVGTTKQHKRVSAFVTDSNIPCPCPAAGSYKPDGKQFYLGAYPSEEEAARASDKLKIKRYLCGWRNAKQEEGTTRLVTLNFHPDEYLEEMRLPEVVAITNWAKYRARLMSLARGNTLAEHKKKAKLAGVSTNSSSG